MLAGFLTILTWKMALYVAVLLGLVWKITRQITTIDRLKADLEIAQMSVRQLKQMQDEGWEVQRRLRDAFTASEVRNRLLKEAIEKMAPPDTPEGAIQWLNSPEAKG